MTPENVGPYVDLPGWLPVPSAKQLRGLMRAHEVESVLEIGSFCGLSTLLFALYADRVTVIDTFKGGDELYLSQPGVTDRINNQRKIFERNMDAFGVLHKIRILEMPSVEGLKLLAEEGAQFDLTYIDGDHREEGVRQDITGALPITGLVICGDDYSTPFPGVVAAVDELVPNARHETRLWYASP